MLKSITNALPTVNDATSKPSVRALLFENKLNVEELMADLGKSRTTIYRWVAEGCPCEKIDGGWWFDAHEVAEWKRRKQG